MNKKPFLVFANVEIVFAFVRKVVHFVNVQVYGFSTMLLRLWRFERFAQRSLWSQ